MKILTSFTLLILCACIVLAIASSFTHAKEGQLPGHEVLDEDQAGYVPNPDESPEMADELACTACSYSVRLMQGAMEKVRLEFERQPEKLKEYHALAAIEDVCKKHKLNVGLLAKDKSSATTEFIHEMEAKQKSAGQHVLKGGWITRFFYTHCEDMLTLAEDHMGEMMKGKDIQLCPKCVKHKANQEKKEKKMKNKKRKSKKAKKENEDL